MERPFFCDAGAPGYFLCANTTRFLPVIGEQSGDEKYPSLTQTSRFQVAGGYAKSSFLPVAPSEV